MSPYLIHRPTTNPNDDSVCQGMLGPRPDPEDCQMYYFCFYGESGDIKYNHLKCENGLLFDKARLYCDWEYNVQCDDAASKEKELSPRFICPGEGFFPDGITYTFRGHPYTTWSKEGEGGS